MKKVNFIIILSFIYSVAGFTQVPVITESNYPIAGESYTGYLDLPEDWEPGTAGPNQTWDFTSLSDANSTTITYENPSGTTYGASFPTANVALSQILNYLYYQRTSAKVDVVGTTTTFTTTNIRPYSNPQTVITFPFTYTNTFKDTADTGVIPAPNSETQRRVTYSETTADAYGTVNLPNSTTFSNVLRVLIASQVIDSTWDSGGSFDSRNVSIDSQYYFISENYKPHVLVLGKNVGPSGTTLLAQYFTTPSAPTSVLAPTNTYIKLFPNPAKSELYLELDQSKLTSKDKITFQLFNNKGQVAYPNTKINSSIQKLSLSHLKPGIYFYHLKDGEKLLESGKVVIE